MVFSLTRGGELPSHPWSTFCFLLFFFSHPPAWEVDRSIVSWCVSKFNRMKVKHSSLRLDRLRCINTRSKSGVPFTPRSTFRSFCRWCYWCWLRALTLSPISSETLIPLLILFLEKSESMGRKWGKDFFSFIHRDVFVCITSICLRQITTFGQWNHSLSSLLHHH